jgi:hypothetical protein
MLRALVNLAIPDSSLWLSLPSSGYRRSSATLRKTPTTLQSHYRFDKTGSRRRCRLSVRHLVLAFDFDNLFDVIDFIVIVTRWNCTLFACLLVLRQCQIFICGIGWGGLLYGDWANPQSLCWRACYLRDLKNCAALSTEDRRTIEIEKGRVAAQTSSLYAEFGFGHCD